MRINNHFKSDESESAQILASRTLSKLKVIKVSPYYYFISIHNHQMKLCKIVLCDDCLLLWKRLVKLIVMKQQ